MKQAIRNSIMLRSRQSKVDHFYTLFEPGMSVLDVGVSGKGHRSGGAPVNYLLQTYRYSPDTYTALAVHDVSGLQSAHPGKRFVRYDGKIFPFENGEFDWVFSNAVIEHVGDRDAQLLFVNEMLRVGRYVFFTTPSKFFPIETHTYMPFIHWNERLFDRWLQKHKPEWRRKTGLWLLSAGDVRRLMNDSAAQAYAVSKNRLLLWPMTMTVIATRLNHLPEPKQAVQAPLYRLGAERAGAAPNAATRGMGIPKAR